MLDNENQVKEDGDVPQKKLDGVAGDATPVTLQGRVNHQLHERQHSSGQIEKDRENAPAYRRLPIVIQPHLRHILEDGGDELNVRQCINLDMPHALVLEQTDFGGTCKAHSPRQSTPRTKDRNPRPGFAPSLFP